MSDHQGSITVGAELLRGVSLLKTYADGDVRALRGVSLAIAEGEFVAITGPSGCGKSTLLHVIGGLDQPTSGQVFFRGRPLLERGLDEFRSRELGFVFQSFHLIPTLTALENVQVPMFESWGPRSQRPIRAQKLLQEVGLSHRLHHNPHRSASGNALRSPAPLRMSRVCYSRMNRPATSIRRPRPRSWNY
jgi:ABC-type lipoprotein export system ATPase subunit